MGEIKAKRKRENPEDFIGKTFNDGKLKVITIIGRAHKNIIYSVFCEICAKDHQLFGSGFFKSTKGNLNQGKLPCGCSSNYKWSQEQYLILAKRSAQDRFIVHGFAEEFHGGGTKVQCECVIDGYKWSSTLHNIINHRRGCIKCAGRYKPTEQEALDKCREICNTENYEVIGFPSGYTGKDSRFEYNCNLHGKQNVNYHAFTWLGTRCAHCAGNAKITEQQAFELCSNICIEKGYTPIGFVDFKSITSSYFEYLCPTHGKQTVPYGSLFNRSSCPSCARYGYNPEKEGTFYIVRWIKDNHSFIKFGITNQKLIRRLKQQERATDYSFNILYSKTTTDGYLPLNLEKSIKHIKDFDIGVMEESVFGDGFTETISETDLDKLLSIVNHWYKEGI